MIPAEKLKEIREKKERLSQAEFAKKYNIKLNSVRFVEQGRQDIPDDLALTLEKEYKIPYKWWKTGEGPMYLGNTYKPHYNPDAGKALEGWGKRFRELQTRNNMSLDEFRAVSGFSERRIGEFIDKNKMPKLEELIKIKEKFDVSIDELLFGESMQTEPMPTPTLNATPNEEYLKSMFEKFAKEKGLL